MKESQDGVLIGDGRYAVRLSCAEPAHDRGYSTLIDVQAGPFSGSLQDDCNGWQMFRFQLAALRENLAGKATLRTYDRFELVLVGNGRGAISVRGDVIGEPEQQSRLSFEFTIDQTYLPAIVAQIDRCFPER
jgi:hypothetical protein